MRRFATVVLSIFIAFSFAAFPAGMIMVNAKGTSSVSDSADTVKLIHGIINRIHSMVGVVYGSFDKDCPVCGETHKDTGVSNVKADVIKKYREALSNTQYILHALGGMENSHTYTNSIDALKACYEEGYRFFEVDISFTSDNKLVCAHSSTVNGVENVWKKADWVNRLGQKYDPDHTLASYEEFMSFKIQGKFKATSFAEIVEFMAGHRDMYLMLDIGSRSYNGTKKIYKAIYETAKGNTDVLNRFIAGGHSVNMMKAVAEVYDFPLLNLYFAAKASRQDELKNPEDFVAYCLENGITSFSTSFSTFGNEDLSLLSSNLIGYVFTTDSSSDALKIHRDRFVVGTNFLR